MSRMLNTLLVLFAMELPKALCCLPTQKASFLFLIYRITIIFLGWSQNISFHHNNPGLFVQGSCQFQIVLEKHAMGSYHKHPPGFNAYEKSCPSWKLAPQLIIKYEEFFAKWLSTFMIAVVWSISFPFILQGQSETLYVRLIGRIYESERQWC